MRRCGKKEGCLEKGRRGGSLEGRAHSKWFLILGSGHPLEDDDDNDNDDDDDDDDDIEDDNEDGGENDKRDVNPP